MCIIFLGENMKKIYVEEVLKEARKAYDNGEIPVGALIIKNDEIIAKAHNTKEKEKNPLKHAELIAIDKACKEIGNWRLDGCKLIVTLQPCPMCASAIKQARIDEVEYFVKIDNSEVRKIVNKILKTNDNNKQILCKKSKNQAYENLWKSFFENMRK